MALPPPIPTRPADRPETWSEYQHRRAVVALHRQQLDQIGFWLKRDPAQWHWALSYQFEPLRFGILQDATIDFNFTPCRDR